MGVDENDQTQLLQDYEQGTDRLRVRARNLQAIDLDLQLDRYGAYVTLEQACEDGDHTLVSRSRVRHRSLATLFADAIQVGGAPFRLETLSLSGAPAGIATSLKTPVLALLAQVQQMELPDPAQLRAARKAWRAEQEAEKAVRVAAQELRRARAEAKVLEAFPEAPPVVDAASFLTALRSRVLQHARIDTALKMLKKSGFQLYSDVADDALQGVIASQSDPDLIYACRIDAAGEVSCCTQNLNICGGLRGEACKHLLTLLIGLVNAGQVDPQRVDAWLAAARGKKPVLDKDKLGDVFLRYHGAQSGEVDWRPTETVPEDFYAW